MEKAILAIVKDRPGIWMVAVCRVLNGYSVNNLICGLCSEFANPRKKANPSKFKLHPPCAIRLYQVKSKIYTLMRQGKLCSRKGQLYDELKHGYDPRRFLFIPGTDPQQVFWERTPKEALK